MYCAFAIDYISGRQRQLPTVIGIEGGKIGLAGAGLGLKAVAGVFKLLTPGYDEDDLERDMEHEAEKLEKKAEKIARDTTVKGQSDEDLTYRFTNHGGRVW